MPEIRYYTVTQKRELHVWANNPIDAAVLAAEKFNGITNGNVVRTIHGKTKGEVREVALLVEEDR